MSDSAYTAYAALELGTSYCGYAFANKFALAEDPPKIHTNPRLSKSDDMKTYARKRMPSCLFVEINKPYQAFVYEAEKKYANDCDNYFFKDIMTLLNEIKGINDPEEKKYLTDVTGKSLSAKKVIKQFIIVLKQHCTDEMKNQTIDISKTRWVITVPVDLKYSTKCFIRDRAVKAGISSNDLMMITEADGAFAHCHELLTKDRSTKLQDSTEYMIVVFGGSTDEIRIVKKVDDLLIEKPGKMKNSSKTSVATEFNDLVDKCFRFKNFSMEGSLKQHPLASLAIARGLENAKYFATRNERIIRIPRKVINTILDGKCKDENLQNMLSSNGDDKKVSLTDTEVCFEDDTAISKIFKTRIDNVVRQMENVFKDHTEENKIQFIVLTGDFYECCLLKPCIRDRFPQKSVIFSKLKEEAVMIGAVLYGHQPYQYTLESLQVYEKTSEQKGLLLVINYAFKNHDKHSYRKASEDDVPKLKSFFQERRYEVHSWVDQTSEELLQNLTTFKNTYLGQKSEDYHCFICVIMSHGRENVIATTTSNITVDQLVDPFRNNNAKLFVGKPKIFMVQTCRGKKVQEKEDPYGSGSDYLHSTLRLPTDADIIKIYATIKDHKSFRRTHYTMWNGAWLIQAFICAVKQYPKKHLLEILTAVNYELAYNPEYEFDNGGCQLSVSEAYLSKLFYV